MKKTVILTRTSNPAQQLVQSVSLMMAAHLTGRKIVKVIHCEDSDYRTSLKQQIPSILESGCDEILVTELSRACRNQSVLSDIVKCLSKKDIEIVTLDQLKSKEALI